MKVLVDLAPFDPALAALRATGRHDIDLMNPPEEKRRRIDPERLRAAAIPVREEPAPGSGERFPHIYGALPIDAVCLALPWEAPTQ